MSDTEHQMEASADDPWMDFDEGGWEPSDASAWDSDPASSDEISFFSGDIHKVYSKDICLAALRGETLATTDIDAMSHVLQLCVLRGIRHHAGFAAELRGAAAVFTRALNARAIMSNDIPDMASDDEIPYCIWYPDVASEDTYRALARRYPQMRYQVGRACAVAGYRTLYMELDLRPDIAIAEEARDSVVRSQRHRDTEEEEEEKKTKKTKTNQGSQDIFAHIIAQPVRWHVMDDYTRRVALDKPPVARYGLNGDTAVVSTLNLRRHVFELRPLHRYSSDRTVLDPPHLPDCEMAPCYFNMTDDWNIDEFTSSLATKAEWRPSEDMLELLWHPLPHDLPWGDRDLLVLMAAYHGDVDRYARLRRPTPVARAEFHCITRGIYNSTAFARWWSIQGAHGHYPASCFARAIHARFIMVNDLSRITADTDDQHLPWQIWHPVRARPETYLELARRKPTMLPLVARALIVADYQAAWDALVDARRVHPYGELMAEARARTGTNPHYLQTLQRICDERHVQACDMEWKFGATDELLLAEQAWSLVVRSPRMGSIYWEQPPPLYDAEGVDASEVELFMAVSKEQRPAAGVDEIHLDRLYSGRTLDVYPRREVARSRGRSYKL